MVGGVVFKYLCVVFVSYRSCCLCSVGVGVAVYGSVGFWHRLCGQELERSSKVRLKTIMLNLLCIQRRNRHAEVYVGVGARGGCCRRDLVKPEVS